jgi:intracellular sulfur oxidation DsrE/DsrF family protein
MKHIKYTKIITLFLIFYLTPFLTIASDINRPFVEKKVVLQISDNDPFKQTLVLNVANNLIKHYGPDKVDIEIVAFGPGIKLLFAQNINRGRIQSLVDQGGVTFSACNNSIHNITRKLGHAPKLNPNAVRVNAGIVRIIDLVEKHYILVKP